MDTGQSIVFTSSRQVNHRLFNHSVHLSSSFAVDHVAYESATRYAERQTRPGSSDSRVPIRRPAIRWLYTVEAEKPVQLWEAVRDLRFSTDTKEVMSQGWLAWNSQW